MEKKKRQTQGYEQIEAQARATQTRVDEEMPAVTRGGGKEAL